MFTPAVVNFYLDILVARFHGSFTIAGQMGGGEWGGVSKSCDMLYYLQIYYINEQNLYLSRSGSKCYHQKKKYTKIEIVIKICN